MLEKFSLIDLSDLAPLAPAMGVYDGCQKNLGRCNTGCGCGTRDGQCGGWNGGGGSTPIHHEPGTGSGGGTSM